jgi:hypothetical protein
MHSISCIRFSAPDLQMYSVGFLFKPKLAVFDQVSISRRLRIDSLLFSLPPVPVYNNLQSFALAAFVRRWTHLAQRSAGSFASSASSSEKVHSESITQKCVHQKHSHFITIDKLSNEHQCYHSTLFYLLPKSNLVFCVHSEVGFLWEFKVRQLSFCDDR